MNAVQVSSTEGKTVSLSKRRCPEKVQKFLKLYWVKDVVQLGILWFMRSRFFMFILGLFFGEQGDLLQSSVVCFKAAR